MRRMTCIKGHPLTEPNLVINGEGFRTCRHCTNNRQVRRGIRKRVKKLTIEEVYRQMEINAIHLEEYTTWLQSKRSLSSTHSA